MKKPVILVSWLIIICNLVSLTAFAAVDEEDKELNNTKSSSITDESIVGVIQPISNYDTYAEMLQPMSSGGLSQEKTQVKTAYLDISGDKLGPVTLQYKTIIGGGRPQFAYDTVKLGYDFRNKDSYYAIDTPMINFTPDKIVVRFPAQFGILADYATVEFKPY